VKKLPFLSVVFAFVLLLVAAGCSSSGGLGAGAAATVNGTDISMSKLYDDLDAIASDPGLRSNFEQNGASVYGPDERSYTTAFASGWLGQLINAELVRQQLDELGQSPNASDQSQAKDKIASSISGLPQDLQDRLVADTANQIALQRILTDEASNEPISDDEVRAFYDERIDSLMQSNGGEVACVGYATVGFDPTGQSASGTPEQVDAAHRTAQTIHDRVVAGESLDTVASSLSGDTVNLVQGGDLNCFGRDQSQLPSDLTDRIFTQPVGAVSDPIDIDGAVVLLLVRSRGVLPFEEVEDEIRQQLESDRGAAAQQRFVRGSTVDVDQRFGTFDVGTSTVTPPEGPTSPSTTSPAAGLLGDGSVTSDSTP
jgi:hypothetical protein